MPDNPTPLATAALDDLIGALTEIRDGYVLDDGRWVEPVEQVEAFRYVGQMLSAMSELYWEAQPQHPRFVSIVDPGRKLQGDNPDAIYHFARVDGTRKYRVTGRMDKECYMSFTLHEAPTTVEWPDLFVVTSTIATCPSMPTGATRS